MPYLRLKTHVRTVIIWGIGYVLTVFCGMVLMVEERKMPDTVFGMVLLVSLAALLVYGLLAVVTAGMIWRKEKEAIAVWMQFCAVSNSMWKAFCDEKRPRVVGGATRTREECIEIYDRIPRTPGMCVPQHINTPTSTGSHPCGNGSGTLSERDVRAMIYVSILDSLKSAGVACAPGILGGDGFPDSLYVLAELPLSPNFFAGACSTCTVTKRNNVALVAHQTSRMVFFPTGGRLTNRSDVSILAAHFAPFFPGLLPGACIIGLPYLLVSLFKGYPFGSPEVRDWLRFEVGLSAEWNAGERFASGRGGFTTVQANELTAHCSLVSQAVEMGRTIAQRVIDRALSEGD